VLSSDIHTLCRLATQDTLRRGSACPSSIFSSFGAREPTFRPRRGRTQPSSRAVADARPHDRPDDPPQAKALRRLMMSFA
jgi:hypothetical protein